MADSGEGVENLALLGPRIAHAVGREDGQAERVRDLDHCLVARFFFAQKMSLKLDINIVATEDRYQALDGAARFFHPAIGERGGERTVVASGQADQPGSMLAQIVFASGDHFRRRVLGAAHLHARDQPAKVLVAGAGLDQQGNTARFTFHVSRFKSPT